ncbi:MAG: glycosyltransferase [Rhodovibrionaceae bacterium]
MNDDSFAPLTILIEWENAQDVEDLWVRKALTALQDELEREHNRFSVPPKVMYLYNEAAVDPDHIRSEIAIAAPKLGQFCDLHFEPTPGLSYYKLKNHGVAITTTDLVVMVDSDAAPEPGWLGALLKPFDDPEVQAVGGFTMLGYNDFVSKVMALAWIFNLRSEREKTEKRTKIHANNCAFRTAFFKNNPWPDLPAFKKQCGFWIRDIEKRRIKWVRTADAMTIHAPWPSFRFLFWRAWTAGLDRDYQGAQTISQSHLRRLGFAFEFWAHKCRRATRRILRKGHEVELPLWQRPPALLVAWGYFTILLVAQIYAALTRSYVPLPATLAALREIPQH